MSQSISNFQYVGYLSDFLGTYHDIDMLTENYKCALSNYKNVSKKIKEYKQTFSFRNCILGWALLFGVLLLSFPLVLFCNVPLFSWFLFCAILSCVIIVISRIIYQKKVLPIHMKRLEGERNKARADGIAMYEALITHRTNLQALRDGIDERCSYPLSVYIMREAAKEGECSNIPQGVHYFNSRYKTLEESEEDASKSLKNNIDSEQTKAEQRQQFLDNLDETSRELFE